MSDAVQPAPPEEGLVGMRAQVYKDPRPQEYFDRFHERARTRPPDLVYEVVRVGTSVYAWLGFRARAIAPEHVPSSGPVILAPNHFSFMDHFFLGAASLAAVGAGLWSQDRVVEGWRERRRFEPQMRDDERRVLRAGWERAVRVTRAHGGGKEDQ